MNKSIKNMFSFRYFKFLTLLLATILVPFSSTSVMAATQPVPMYRLYNSISGQHLFTIDSNEVSVLLGNSVWKEETSSFKVYDNCTDAQPYASSRIERFLSSSGLHLTTADMNEQTILSNNVNTYHYYEEANPYGYGCVSMTQIAGTIPVYRLYNHVNGEHLLTADNNEVSALNGKNNWSLEGVAFYAYPNQ